MNVLSPVLVLNATYEPVSICAARRAITLLIKGAAFLEETYEQRVWRDMQLPSVIRLRRYRRVPKVRHDVTRRSIFARDQNTCQYCLTPLSATRLTLDHVIPRSKGGTDTWENLVSCCRECNHRKADRTPDEAGMKLARRPLPVTIHTSRTMLRNMGQVNTSWQKYLFY
jgi:5-methylcytosine-specific restriction endonuclease McrA